MRISEWSSDLCLSDLAVIHRRRASAVALAIPAGAAEAAPTRACDAADQALMTSSSRPMRVKASMAWSRCSRVCAALIWVRMRAWSFGTRSEEHTSELQSLMRISYAVLCLKKKKYVTKNNHEHD